MLLVEAMNVMLQVAAGMLAQRGFEDRRRGDRFPIEREMRFRVEGRRGYLCEGAGTTLNISSGGVLFSTEQEIPVGSRIELSISWPAQLENKCNLKLVARGRVTRRGPGQAAVEIQQYEFRTQGSKGLSF
jgi:hypothetical protein